MKRHTILENVIPTYLYSDANHKCGNPPKPVTRCVEGDPLVQDCVVTGVYSKSELEDDVASLGMVGKTWAVRWYRHSGTLFCDFSTKEPIGKHANYYVDIDPVTRDLRFFTVLRNGLKGDHVNTWHCLAQNCERTISWHKSQHI